MNRRLRLSIQAGILMLVFLVSYENVLADDWTITGDNSFSATVNTEKSFPGVQITGATSPVPVKLRVSHGTLRMTTITGLTFNNDVRTESTLYFSGSLEDVNAALATLKYTPTESGSDALEVSLVDPGEVFFADNGHLYEYVSSSGSWDSAKPAAEARTKYGATGYLTTITSSAENDFVSARLEDAGWMGASDSVEEGNWKWVTGPEVGTQFWQGAGAGAPVDGMYANWNGGEPNDYMFGNPGEDCGQFLSGGSGEWNDLPCGVGQSLPGYVVEYGAPGALPTVTAKNIAVTVAEAPTTESIEPQGSDVALNTNIVMTFTSPINIGTGNILFYRNDQEEPLETIDVTGSKVTGGGTNTITINPDTVLESSTLYYMLMASGVFVDDNGAPYAGISSGEDWNFTTGDFSVPLISELATSTTDTTATISWSTDQLSTSELAYALPDIAYVFAPSVYDADTATTSHEVTLSNLESCTIYHFSVSSADDSNNVAYSNDGSFRTTGCPVEPDPTPEPSPSSSPARGTIQSSEIRYGCKDKKALNYEFFARHDRSLCKYATSSILPVVATTTTIVMAKPIMNERDLYLGLVGEDVRDLQKFLNKVGHPLGESGPGSAGQETDFFGVQTKKALIEFQYKNKITPAIGFFGPLTRALVNSIH